MSRILVIAAHPDDETLGAGGTLLRHRAEQDSLAWCIVTVAWQPRWGAEAIRQKGQEVQAVDRAYGFEAIWRMGLPTTRVTAGDLLDHATFRPMLHEADVIYTVGPHDVHSDHAAVFEAVMIATKPAGARGRPQRILTMEIPSSTECGAWRRPFVPTVFTDITAFREEKLRILALYASEAQPDPLPRSPCRVGMVARMRGGAIGVDAAEAFELVREIR